MTEKVLTFYDNNDMRIKGILIAKLDNNDILIYKNPLTLYSKQPLTSEILAHISVLRERRTHIANLKETLSIKLFNGLKENNITILDPFVLESNNNNETSRNKRMLKYMNLEDLERIDIYDKDIEKKFKNKIQR